MTLMTVSVKTKLKSKTTCTYLHILHVYKKKKGTKQDCVLYSAAILWILDLAS